MTRTTMTLGAALLLCAASAGAQVRGTMELGAFGSVASFDRALSLERAYGGGGRIGMYFDPRWSAEFEKGEMRASRPNSLKDVNVGILAGRLVATPVTMGRLSLMLGAGAGVSTETNFLHSYGLDALAGAKVRLSERAALRVDGVFDWLANEDWKTYRSVRAGLTLYRHPNRMDRVVAVRTPMPVMRDDSVSAGETRRLRERDAALSALRDSLRLAPPPVTLLDDAIHFAFGRAELSDSARTVLDAQVARLGGYQHSAVVLVSDSRADGDATLGGRRARATKDHLIARGIAADRVFIDALGEGPRAGDSAGPGRHAVLRVRLVGDAIRIKKDGR